MIAEVRDTKKTKGDTMTNAAEVKTTEAKAQKLCSMTFSERDIKNAIFEERQEIERRQNKIKQFKKMLAITRISEYAKKENPYVKGNEYIYLEGSEFKVKGRIGRIVKFELINNLDADVLVNYGADMGGIRTHKPWNLKPVTMTPDMIRRWKENETSGTEAN